MPATLRCHPTLQRATPSPDRGSYHELIVDFSQRGFVAGQRHRAWGAGSGNEPAPRAVGLLLVLALILAACACSNAGDEQPPWVLQIAPSPGAAVGRDARIVVSYQLPAGQEVRLLVDDQDVTAHTTRGEGRLIYDPAASPLKAPLVSQWHTVTVQRVRPGVSGDGLVDAFTWEFWIY